MSLCQSIDTLAMAYLDDELVAEEKRELELHLLECTECRSHVDAERADLDLVRGALVAPPAPDMLKARINRALDVEDRESAKALRRKWSQWILPGTATIAAAAAIMMFVFVRPPAATVTRPSRRGRRRRLSPARCRRRAGCPGRSPGRSRGPFRR